jgi:ferritin-like metal-binding protein YciE
MKTTATKSKARSTASKTTASKTAAPKSVATKAAPKTNATSKAKSAPKTTKGVVKAKRTAAEGLRDLLVEGLKDIYWAEKALTKALPKMAKNATSADLTAGIEKHLAETQNQISRLEQVFASIGEKAVAKKCDAMDGLLKEGEGIMEETELGAVRDAGIIAAAQKVEHYEIATYGTLRVFAEILGETEAVELLSQTLEEEKNCDMLLTEVAVAAINIEAAEGDTKE